MPRNSHLWNWWTFIPRSPHGPGWFLLHNFRAEMCCAPRDKRPSFTGCVHGVEERISLRTARHRITRWGNEGELGWELYDHQADPSELDNLADHPDMRSTMDSLQQVLLQMDSSHKVVPDGVGRVNPLARPLPRVAPLLKRPPLESPEP